ncbi:PTS sugar transporter subunit IIA [Paenibacillus medicaginis]|uniref:PTS glucose transporter subunit IIA n=1 Tax=Paenibacillus medicaginis TaxID=1470560 RepID=A0ABV5BYE9_9BACL
MFHWGKNKKTLELLEVVPPISGKMVELKEVPDPAFAQGHMGAGAAIEPVEGKVYAPFDGKIALLMDKSKHAVIVEHKSGAQVLIHIGIDTVSLKGNGFKAHVKTGAKVKQGQLLLEFDMDMIQAAGLSLLSPVIVPDGLESVDRVEPHVGQEANGHSGLLITVHLKS